MSSAKESQAPKTNDEECFRRLNVLDAKASALLRLCSMVTLLVTLIGLESNNRFSSKSIRLYNLSPGLEVDMRSLLVLFGVTAAFFVFSMFCMIPILHVKFSDGGYEDLVQKRTAFYLVGYWSCLLGMISLAAVLALVFLQHYQS